MAEEFLFRQWLLEYDNNWHDDDDELEDERRRNLTYYDAVYGRDFAFDHWFRNGDRIYLPFETYAKEGEEEEDSDYDDESVISAVEEFKGGGKLPKSEDGYTVVDYKKGLAAPKSKPQVRVRIGKILQTIDKQEQEELKQKFAADEISQINYNRQVSHNRKYMDELKQTFEMSHTRASGKSGQKKYMVVISKDPKDIAHMTTGRKWTSCMRLNTDKESDIYCEIRDGGFIAYLTDPEDKEIERPKARLLIRRFDSKRGGKPVAMVEDSVYGWDVPGFVKFVKKWVETKQGKIEPGEYVKKGAEESDTFSNDELVTPREEEELWKWADSDNPSYSAAALGKLLDLDSKQTLSPEKAKQLYDIFKKTKRFTRGTLTSLIRNHPELYQNGDFDNLGMDTYEMQRTIDKLPPEKQAGIRNQVLTHLMANLKYPSPIQKNLTTVDYPYKFINIYRDLLNEAQIFKPIPEPLMKQIVQLANELYKLPITKEFAGGESKKHPHGEYKPGYVEESILNDIASTLYLTRTDSPSAIAFIRNHMFQRGFRGFDYRGEERYNSWFGAIGGLGAQGREFLPQLKKELSDVQERLSQSQKELAELKDRIGSIPLGQKVKIENEIRRLEKAEEEYNWTIDSIESGKGRSTKYYPFG